MKNTWWIIAIAILCVSMMLLSACSGETGANDSQTEESDSSDVQLWKNHPYAAGIPKFTGGKFLSDSNDFINYSLLLTYSDTAPEAFNAYRQQLLDAGLEQDYHTSEPSNEQYIYTNNVSNVFLLYQPELQQLQVQVYPAVATAE